MTKLNTNTAFKCIAYCRNSAFFADSSRALSQCTLLFCSLFQLPLGKQSFQYMSGETPIYTLSHQGQTKLWQFYSSFIRIFSFFKSTTGNFSAKAVKALASFRSPFLIIALKLFFQLTGYSISQHTASQPCLLTARLYLLCIYISMTWREINSW